MYSARLRLIGSVSLLFLFVSSALSQTGINKTLQSLSLTTRIIEQKYCDSEYPDMAMLRLPLRLTYTNVSEQPLILYKGSNLIHYVLVSANEQEARDKHYETDMHVGWVTSGVRLAEGAKPGSEFAVLAPRESKEVDGGNVDIAIDLNSTTKFLKAAQHVFQGVTETWPESEEQFDRLKRKWEKVGVLGGGSVRSESMPLMVDKAPQLVQCQ